MTTTARTGIRRANAVFLMVAATGGLAMDILGSFFARGPESVIVADAPGSGIGFIEAHGLALILGTLLRRATSARSWHFTAAAVHVLLGTANLVFWPFFVVSDSLAAGSITTTFRWMFVALQLTAAAAVRPSAASCAVVVA